MEALKLIMILLLAGIITGGGTGVVLYNWPARSPLRSLLKGAFFGMSIFLAAALIVSLASFAQYLIAIVLG